MNIEHKIVNRTLYTSIQGELDEHTAPMAREILDRCIASTGFNRIIFELSNLHFMDSTGLGVLIGRYKKLLLKKDENGKIVSMFIATPSKQVDKLLTFSGVYKIMPKLNNSN